MKCHICRHYDWKCVEAVFFAQVRSHLRRLSEQDQQKVLSIIDELGRCLGKKEVRRILETVTDAEFTSLQTQNDSYAELLQRIARPFRSQVHMHKCVMKPTATAPLQLHINEDPDRDLASTAVVNDVAVRMVGLQVATRDGTQNAAWKRQNPPGNRLATAADVLGLNTLRVYSLSNF